MRPRGIVAALVPHGPDSWADLARGVQAIASRLPPPTPGSEVAFAFGCDRRACLAALLATWVRGHTAVVARDATRDSVAPLLARPRNAGFVHDTGVGRGLYVPRLLEQAPRAEPPATAPLEEGRPALITVRPRAFAEPLVERWSEERLLAHLEGLAARLELATGERLASTLTPTALPGLFLGLLAPLRRGLSVEAGTPVDAADAARVLRERGARALVATAAHARALAELPRGALGGLERLHCVDGSPGRHPAALLARRHGVRADVLPDLECAEPLAPELEVLRDALLASDSVRDVAVVVVPEREGEVARALVAVQAQEHGREEAETLFAEHRPRALSAALRFLLCVPRDENGLVRTAELLLAFGRGRSGRELVRALEWAEVPGGTRGARRFRARLPRDYAPFEGHFPGHPVLAGVAQLSELVLPCVRRVRPACGALVRLSRVKFLAPIAPEEEVEVALEEGPEPSAVAFSIERGGTRCALGWLHFEAPGSAGR